MRHKICRNSWGDAFSTDLPSVVGDRRADGACAQVGTLLANRLKTQERQPFTELRRRDRCEQVVWVGKAERQA